MARQLVSEGGNIFKNDDGTLVTQRINKADVDPTLAWVEAIVQHQATWILLLIKKKLTRASYTTN